MTPDDPRHGTPAGHRAHFRAGTPTCQPCRDAHTRHRKSMDYLKRTRGMESTLIPSLGTQRRIRALQAMGWTMNDIASRAGVTSRRVEQWLRHDQIHYTTAEKVAAVYEALSMTLGPSNMARVRARNRGYLPPLAWDDIDRDPDPKRRRKADAAWQGTIDHAIVERVLCGEKRPRKLTWAEGAEITRRLVARGLSWAQIEEMYGFKVERYVDKGAA
jgi:transcriptional regulator with XRE-family HTH domain